MNNTDLTLEINDLKTQVAELKSMLSIVGMPYELKEIIRNEVIKSEDLTVPVTQTIIIDDTPTSITVPVNPTGTLIVKWRGKEYKLLYV